MLVGGLFPNARLSGIAVKLNAGLALRRRAILYSASSVVTLWRMTTLDTLSGSGSFPAELAARKILFPVSQRGHSTSRGARAATGL
jgi:hypothetical protein